MYAFITGNINEIINNSSFTNNRYICANILFSNIMKKFIEVLLFAVVVVIFSSCSVSVMGPAISSKTSTWIRCESEFSVPEYIDKGVFAMSAGENGEGTFIIGTLRTYDQEAVIVGGEDWMDINFDGINLILSTKQWNSKCTATCWIKQNSKWYKYSVVNVGLSAKEPEEEMQEPKDGRRFKDGIYNF